MRLKRNNLIDFLRGLAIVDMILVHFSSFFPDIIRKIVVYHDFAIEGFILLAGFVIGNIYYPKFLLNRKLVTNNLIVRSFKLIIIHYLLIITISWPQYLIMNDNITIVQSYTFLINSVTFSNQIGLIHILPTFVPLFFLSPLMLFFSYRGFDKVLLLISLFLFFIGQINPYLFNYGEKTIFPIILWQVYFVFGFYFGKFSFTDKQVIPKNITLLFYFACMALLINLTFKHNLILSNIWFLALKNKGLIISKFPLNTLGLIYGASLIFFMFTFNAKYWSFLKEKRIILIISLFGRHGLLFFSIHVYFYKTICIVNYKMDLNIVVINLYILISIVLSYLFLKKYELNLSDKCTIPYKFLKWLF